MTTTQEFDAELDLLVRVRNRLSNPENWCQYDLGTEDGPNCVLGAMFHEERAAGFLPFEFNRVYSQVTRLAGRPLDIYNNTHEHADILDLLDRAIAERTAELAEKETA